MAGFTAVRNVGAGACTDVALRDAVNDGELPGPRMLVSGPALGITGGHCDNNLLPFEYHKEGEAVADGIAAVQHKVREVIKYGADVIKICATGGVLSKGDDPKASQYTLEEMKAIVAEAHRLGLDVVFHSCGNVTSIVDDLIDVGVDALDPVQPGAMDAVEVARRFGGRIAFCGSIDDQKAKHKESEGALYRIDYGRTVVRQAHDSTSVPRRRTRRARRRKQARWE